MAGSCRILLHNGLIEEWVKLEEPQTGLLIDRLIWHEMYDFSEDCVLLVFASDHFNEKDYIRDFNQFKHAVLALLSWYRCQMKVCKVRVECYANSGRNQCLKY